MKIQTFKKMISNVKFLLFIVKNSKRKNTAKKS